ncbi:MAG: stage II sporulation protein M [Sphingobacteriales bacterium]|nr:MAG: stage II sporulation protein M [Sphingobacteriales bacterium]
MREVQFLKQNSETWKAFEQTLNAGSKVNPDLLAEQYIRIQDDLSYARTFFHDSATTRYLNELASLTHQRIYRNRKEKSSRFFTFWKYEVPLVAYQLRKPILYSFIIFMVSVLLGVLSLSKDDTFARLVLGDGYINETLNNIKNKDPMGIYKQSGPLLMFFRIAINNIKVAFSCFAIGILFSFGSGFMLFKNGVMLGVFQYFFHMHGLLLNSALTIWIHGTLEISAIILSGGAGLALGNSLLFPKTYSRMHSLKKASANGIKLMISLFPVFVIAAFLESYVTRHTEMPLILSLAIIGSSLAFIVFYYIIYPHKLYHKKHDTSQKTV